MENMGKLKGSSVFITGGTGFVGGHLVEDLIKKGITPIILERTINPKSYFSIKNLHKKSIVIIGDVRDKEKIKEIIVKYSVSHIFHLAALAIVPQAYEDPYTTIETNVLGTAALLEACRLYGHATSIIVASSDKAYGILNKKKYKETDPLYGSHPYDASKSAADIIAQSYAKTYAMPIVVTRFGNIYGEGDLNLSRIIPGCMESMISNKKLQIRSDGTLVRDYVYVKDVVNGYIALAENIEKTRGEAFNFSSKEGLSVVDVVKLLEKTLNKRISYTINNTARHEIPYQSLDDTKARKRINYKNKYTIKSTAEDIYNWYKTIISL